MNGPTRARPWVRAVPLGLAAVLVLAGIGCGADDHLDTGTVEAKIARSLAATYDQPVTAVSCPDRIKSADGTRFTCSSRIAGERLEVVVTESGPTPDLRVVPTAAVLVMAEVRADIAKQVASSFRGAKVAVDCGAADVRVLAADRMFQCTASAGNVSRKVSVHVRDVDGSLTYDLRD